MSNPKFGFPAGLAFAILTLTLSACKPKTDTSQTAAVDVADPLVKSLVEKYGVLPYLGKPWFERDWDNYAACLPQPLKETLFEIDKRLGLNPYEVFTVVIGEGLGFLIDGAFNEEQFLRDPVSGYGYLGLDTFGSDLPRLRALDLLPATFRDVPLFDDLVSGKGEYWLEKQTRSEPGDNGQTVQVLSAHFRNMKTAFEAFGAVYARRKKMFDEERIARKFRAPTADESFYWTYFYFQNPAAAGRSLRKYGLSFRYALSTEKDSSRPQYIPLKSLKRVVTARHVAAKKALEEGAKCHKPIGMDHSILQLP